MQLFAADVRITMADALKNATTKPKPEYSSIARQMKVAGKVDVEVIISPEGSVEDVKVLSGNALLTTSTVEAVKKWRFTPFTAGGAPARAIAALSFDFHP